MKIQALLMASMAVLSLAAHAADKGLNGGDICEDRFKTIRDDISSWIKKGGSAGLNLTDGVSLDQYDAKMLSEIASAEISCVDSTVSVNGAEKACKNFVDWKGTPQIVCNNSRFMATSDSDQYVLVHHEYAGLSGFEVNDGKSSNYPLSNQISGYLADETVKRLVIKEPAKTIARCLEVISLDGQFVCKFPYVRDSNGEFFLIRGDADPQDVCPRIADGASWVRDSFVGIGPLTKSGLSDIKQGFAGSISFTDGGGLKDVSELDTRTPIYGQVNCDTIEFPNLTINPFSVPINPYR